MAYRAVDNHVYDRVRHFLRRRHVESFGYAAEGRYRPIQPGILRHQREDNRRFGPAWADAVDSDPAAVALAHRRISEAVVGLTTKPSKDAALGVDPRVGPRIRRSLARKG